MGVLGGVIAAGRDYSEVFEVFRPGFDLDRERESLTAAHGPGITEGDLYPEVRQALSDLRRLGVWVGIVGNRDSPEVALADFRIRSLDELPGLVAAENR